MSRRAGMYGSEAALVRIEQVILTTTAVTADSGPSCLEAKGWRNWTFTVESNSELPSGCNVTWYGTNDPRTAGSLSGTPPVLVVPITNSNWFVLPGEATQSGTGTEANPLTSITQSLSYDRPLRAVRAVVAGNTLGNRVRCKVAAVP